MTNLINFELVSPESKLVSEPMHMVVIPGVEGEFGVLAGHSALVATVDFGVIELHKEEGDKPRRIFVAGGFADVTPETCVVLAEEATNVADLKEGEIKQKIKDLNEDLGLAKEAVDKARINKRLKLEQAKIQAISGKIAA